MRRLGLARCAIALLPLCGVAVAQAPGSASPGPASAPAGNTDAADGTVSAQPSSNAVSPSCTETTRANTRALPPISITVNPATIWQPRGGEVIVAVSGDAALFKGFIVRACFGWSDAAPGDFFTARNLSRFSDAFVRVRPTDTLGLVNLGVIVPNMPNAPSSLLTRWIDGGRSTGLGLVPIVDMRLIGYSESGVLFDVVRPVGVTSVSFSLSISIASAAVALLVLHRLATGTSATLSTDPNRSGATRTLWLAREALKLRWILNLVRDSDGRASLSAFQILLWSILVATSAIYVMALSGSLINITAGTLVLLGIAGGAALMTAGAGKQEQADQRRGVLQQAELQPLQESRDQARPPASQPRIPRWADLVRDDNEIPEVTRLQMLFFTVVSAIFVAMQVLNNYVIPDIPSGYQILMGISNGIYVGKKFT